MSDLSERGFAAILLIANFNGCFFGAREKEAHSLHGGFMNMGDSLGLIGKRLLLLLNDGGGGGGGCAAGTASAANQSAVQAEWLRGTVRAVSVTGLASPGVEVRKKAPSTLFLRRIDSK